MGARIKRQGAAKGGSKKALVRPLAGVQRVVRTERLEELRDQLREAQETLDAIRNGEVDAVVVTGAHGNQIYSLAGVEQPYRLYVEQMQEGAVTVSGDCLVLFCNQRFAEMLGLPLGRVISSKLSDYITEDSCKALSHIFKNGTGVVKHEGLLRTSAGSFLPVSFTANRLAIEGQDAMCLVVTDLTQHKERMKLMLAKELAEKANATKDDFLAALSHELRTPLTPVLMSAANLEIDERLPGEIRQELAMIRRNVELEARLIDDLLDLTRITRGKLELHLGAIDIHNLVHRAVEICRKESEAKAHLIRFELRAQQSHTEGDGVRIQQAIWNLVRNAVKFTPPEGSITIKTHNPRPEVVHLEVHDTGIGFEPGNSERLFKAFEQGNREITRQFGGLGLGLAITRSIIQAHGGMVRAESAGPGKGATFVVGLPIRVFAGQQTNPSAEAGSPNPRGRRLRLLLVEDHSDTRKSMESLLIRYRHEVKSASSAEEALAMAEKYEFDLVISDLGLPDRSGLQLMRELRDRFGLKGIGVTGYGMEEDIAESHAAGFVRHLIKPIGLEELRKAITAVVDGA